MPRTAPPRGPCPEDPRVSERAREEPPHLAGFDPFGLMGNGTASPVAHGPSYTARAASPVLPSSLHEVPVYGNPYTDYGGFGVPLHSYVTPQPAAAAGFAPRLVDPPVAPVGWSTTAPQGREADRIHFQMIPSSSMEYKNWRRAAQISIVMAARDPVRASDWIAEIANYTPEQLIARFDPQMASLEVKLSQALQLVARGRVQQLMSRWLDLHASAVYCGRAILRMLDLEIVADVQLEVNVTLNEWLNLKPKGNTPDAVDEFIAQWSTLTHKLAMAGQPVNPSMVRTMFLQKVEPVAQFASADFAIWKRIPSGDPTASVEALMSTLRETSRRWRQEHQLRDRSHRVNVAQPQLPQSQYSSPPQQLSNESAWYSSFGESEQYWPSEQEATMITRSLG